MDELETRFEFKSVSSGCQRHGDVACLAGEGTERDIAIEKWPKGD